MSDRKLARKVNRKIKILPNTDALNRHWKRSYWAMNMWRQANYTEIILQLVIRIVEKNEISSGAR